MISRLNWYIKNSRKNSDSAFYTFINAVFIKLKFGKAIFIYPNTELHGIQNIYPKKALHIGTDTHEISHSKDATLVNIEGKMTVDSEFYHIGRGSRIYVAKNAELNIGNGGFINPFTKIIVENGVRIGDDCYISWNCQILDEDYHEVFYGNKVPKDKKIEIGNHVWIGSGARIFQGTKIAADCVVAANAVVRGVFEKPSCIIGGNPAKVIRENISWK